MNIRLQTQAPKGQVRGFSLIELVTVVCIIAILAAVAYPSFMQSVRDSRRTDAQVALTRTSQNLERFFGTNGTYTTDESLLGLSTDPDSGLQVSDGGNYVITVTAGATGIGSSYTVTASAIAGSGQTADEGCTSLSMNSRGVRTPAGDDCW